jgi:hypothetical protein
MAAILISSSRVTSLSRNTTTEACAFAFEVLRKHPDWGWPQINDEVRNAGPKPIANRSWVHINRFLAHGCKEYVPINQFDVLVGMGMV